MHDTVFQCESNGAIFEVHPLAALLNEFQIWKIWAAVLVESDPYFRPVYVGRVDFDIAAELPGV